MRPAPVRPPPCLGSRRRPPPRAIVLGLGVIVAAAAMAACGPGRPSVTPRPSAGTVDHPREVNIIAREYTFSPDPVDLLPGETVLLHIVDAGLETHEVVIGDAAVQDAWEAAEAAASPAPPGATPIVVPPATPGLRVVVTSGQRVDVLWTVPAAPPAVSRLIVGCHIPGHYAKGMHVAVRVP